jgi:hypothetical protein
MTIKQVKNSLVHIQVNTYSTIDWLDKEHNIYNEVTEKYYTIRLFSIPIFIRDRRLETVHILDNLSSKKVGGFVKPTAA